MERRKSLRVDLRDRVCITVLPKSYDNPLSETFYCKTDDLSATGVRFTGAATFTEGQILELLIIRGCAFRGFEFKGRVAWVTKDPQSSASSFGIEFTGTGEETLTAWREALESAPVESQE